MFIHRFKSRTVFQELSKLQVNSNWSAAMHKKVKVQVRQGKVIGEECFSSNGTIFHSFKGIPYSVPPIGKLRFKSPVPLDYFEKPEIDCSKERDVCYQRDPFTQQIIGSENCLYLNIYAPLSRESNGLLPVMVFIHGGGFRFGSGNSDTLFPERFVDENVIVVTLNYRLDALGFLCLPEEGIWGNAGLKDQRLALQWVHDNIREFNGNPNNVTLFGESAGAAAVHIHAYADHANKLFHKAIIQSGTANMEWIFQINPVFKAHSMAKLLGYTSTEFKNIVEFLQSDRVTPIDLFANSLRLLTADERRRGLPLAFKPVIEDISSPDKIISKPIIDLMQTPNALQVPIIMGYNSGESMSMTINAIRKLEDIDNDLERYVPRNIPLSVEHDSIRIKEIAREMRNFYFNGKKIDMKSLNALNDLLSDYHFIIDAQKAAEWQVNFQTSAPLYFYRFNYVGGRNLYKYILQYKHIHGACHADELCYMFQMKDNDNILLQFANDDKSLKKDDELCSKRLCSLWANFARYGRPTIGSKNAVIDFQWNPVRKSENENSNFELDYLAIDKSCEMRKNPDYKRVQFWRNIYRIFMPTDYSRLSAKL